MSTVEISFVVILAVIVAFYFIFIWPARREQRRLEETIRSLRVGDEDATTSGFFALAKKIHTPEEGPVQLVLEPGNALEVRSLTSAVARRVAAAPDPAGRPEEAKGA